MPVWHKATQELRDRGDLMMLGVIQEQHAERCRLYAQWQQFDWPILHDPLNKLELAGVPIVVEIDEQGVTRSVNPNVDEFVASFKASQSERGQLNREVKTGQTAPPDIDKLRRAADADKTYKAWQALGDALVLWEGSDSLDEAIRAFDHAKNLQPKDAAIHFRLGVAHRMRYDAAKSRETSLAPITPPLLSQDLATQMRPDDFQLAAAHWQQALDLNPNQYIYRRRIQQYGPRLAKPYPFYDWVDEAKREIEARGERPIELTVPLTGSELAAPTKQFVAEEENSLTSPDPEGRIRRDLQGLIAASAVVVPQRLAPDETARVHLEFRPRAAAHWNNEVDPLIVWLELPDGWAADRRHFSSDLPLVAESTERRGFDFEVQPPASLAEPATLHAYALYYVCEEKQGACLYLRQDFEIPIRIEPR